MALENEDFRKDGKSKEFDPASQLTREFTSLKDAYMKQGLSDEELYNAFMKHVRRPEVLPLINTVESKPSRKRLRHFALFICLPVLLAFLGHSYMNEDSFLYGEGGVVQYVQDSKCLVDNGGLISEVTRPLADCRMCKGLKEVPVVEDLTSSEFVQKFAYSGVPVLVKQATQGWSAMETFNFNYFKNLYNSIPDALEITDQECQFFPYDTEFVTLGEAFNMSDDRANFRTGQRHWYFGWSNCQKETASELRKHYQKPHFLPPESESSAIDWIFMGGPGRGAYIHVDSVERPSWQAQITGRKTWSLFPPPECESVCQTINATMETGDITE